MSSSTRFAVGVALSPLIGVLIGVVIDDIGMGMAYGLCGGVVLGALLMGMTPKKKIDGDDMPRSED